MFKEMGTAYFEYLCKSFYHYCPTAIAKTLGAFKIKIKDKNNKKSNVTCLLMMENMLLNVNPDSDKCCMYDLKGSNLKRYIATKKKG
jgi:hypothetical protein